MGIVDQNISTQLDDLLNKAEFKGTSKCSEFFPLSFSTIPRFSLDNYLQQCSIYYRSWIVKEGF